MSVKLKMAKNDAIYNSKLKMFALLWTTCMYIQQEAFELYLSIVGDESA